MRAMIIIGTIALAFGIGIRVPRSSAGDASFRCVEDQVWTWDGTHGFPAPHEDYRCVALDDLMAD